MFLNNITVQLKPNVTASFTILSDIPFFKSCYDYNDDDCEDDDEDDVCLGIRYKTY
jgi:hypothetical protein